MCYCRNDTKRDMSNVISATTKSLSRNSYLEILHRIAAAQKSVRKLEITLDGQKVNFCKFIFQTKLDLERNEKRAILIPIKYFFNRGA
mmetsp:Transcript_23937/g.77837  ORF Transcript_23937/g.77837 Transcript_23937/m.77837 type:complete len:88 (-) Transcript_23937:1079-1342(-)